MRQFLLQPIICILRGESNSQPAGEKYVKCKIYDSVYSYNYKSEKNGGLNMAMLQMSD